MTWDVLCLGTLSLVHFVLETKRPLGRLVPGTFWDVFYLGRLVCASFLKI